MTNLKHLGSESQITTTPSVQAFTIIKCFEYFNMDYTQTEISEKNILKRVYIHSIKKRENILYSNSERREYYSFIAD